MSHGDLYEKARGAIDDLFSDNSVPLDTIRSSLEELIRHARTALDALNATAKTMSEQPIR